MKFRGDERSDDRPAGRVRAVVLGLLAISILLFQSEARADLSDLLDPWRWVAFGQSTGRPHEGVTGVEETPDGTIWVMTNRGLTYYDDYELQPVTKEIGDLAGQESLFSRFGENSVIVARGRLIYTGGRDGFRRVEIRGATGRGRISALAHLGPERTLALLDGRLLDVIPGTGIATPTTLPSPPGRVLSLREAPRLHWVDTSEGSFTWKAGTWRPLYPPELRDSVAAEMLAVRDGRLVADIAEPIEKAGLWTWSEDTAPTRIDQTDRPRRSTTLDADADGRLVIAYPEGGLNVRIAGEWVTIRPPALALGLVNQVRFAADGDLLVATTRGLLRWRRHDPHWEHWPAGEGFRREQINEIFLDRDGVVWIGTGLGVEQRFPDGTVVSHDPTGTRKFDHVTGINQDSSGRIWVSSGGSFPGAYRWDGRSWEPFGEEQGLGDAFFHKIRRDRSGRLWFLGLGRIYPDGRPGQAEQPGPYVLDGDVLRPWSEAGGLHSQRVYAFAEGPEGTLWFGTQGGLNRYRDGEWTYWPTPVDPWSSRTYTLAVDHENRVWFSDQIHGIRVLDGDRIRHVSQRDGLVSDRVNEIRVGPDGRIWVGTDSGVSVHSDGTWSDLTVDQGLSGHRVWTILPLEDRVLIGTAGTGTNVLDLRHAEDPPPRVILDPPVLDRRGVFLSWRVAAYRGRVAAGEIEIRHRLDGEAWSGWTRARSLLIARPRSGNHRFEVQAKGFLGSLAAPERVHFDVEPPLYLRPAFYLTVGGLSLSVLALGAMFLVRSLAHNRRLRESEGRLRSSEARLRTARDLAGLGDWDVDVAAGTIMLSPETRRTFGLSESTDALGIDEVMALIHEEDRSRVRAALEQSFEDGVPYGHTFRIRGDGTGGIRHVKHRGKPVRDASGRVTHVFGTSFDITDVRHLEERLRQAQKMEAIGRLAGGVAHDFNNLLVAVLGHCDLLSLALPENRVHRHHVDEIRQAARRAEGLTRQLLAFSRKQMLRPVVFDLNVVLADLIAMLERLIGEDVTLSVDLADEPALVVADSGQVEQVVMNLVTNARDAMPMGGVIRIGTAVRELSEPSGGPGEEIPAGRYAVITVADTGVGLDPESLRKIFEPFFTTKAVGKGTGLGLATVYGIARQSGGDVRVRTSREDGTTFEVFLPTAPEGAIPVRRGLERTALERGRETILVAEDEGSVARLLTSCLEMAGHRVLVANDGETALAIGREHRGEIDLMLVDVVMPGIGGREVVETLRAEGAAPAALYMTGYTEDEAFRAGVIERGEDLIEKPFTPSELTAKVREVLDRR